MAGKKQPLGKKVKKEKLIELINEVLEEQMLDEEGKKDACYHKVKARYDVWPSAYASGALVKCRKVGAKNWGNKSKKDESLNEEFETHDMFDPKTGKKFVAKKEQDHKDMAAKGYTHVDPKRIEKVLRDEGGASGMDPFLKEFGEDMEEEIVKTLEAMPNVGQHKDKDYILDDSKEVEIVKERKKNCGCGQDPCKTYGVQEAKNYHWDEPDWHYNGGYGDPESPHAKWYLKSEAQLNERCQKGYKTHDTQKTKEMFGKTYRNCVKAEESQDLEEKKKKAGTESSKESNLGDWFKRKGAKGSKGGWVDCNAPDGKGGYKSCGRSDGEKRKRYPSCRPTPGACKEKGKGKSWGKKGAKKKNEVLDMRKGFLFEGDDSILTLFEGATLEEGGLVCEACLFETLQEASCGCPDLVGEAVYQGKTVQLNKPTRGDVKKFKVYVNSGKKDAKGRVKAKKVNFGDKNMKIKKSNPKRRKSFRARHKCHTAKDKTTARYWSCKKW